MKAGRPKTIRIEDNSEGKELDFRLYKVWSKKKSSPQPFLITSSLEDLIEKYQICCRDYQIKPDMKTILELVNKYNNKQKEFKNEQTNFLKGSFFG